MRFHFRASIKPIFENHVFRAVSGPFHTLYETKISNRSPSVVYGSITLKIFSGALWTSPHQWFNRQNKIKKVFFWDTLLYNDVFFRCIICLFSLQELDEITKTECLHFFHKHCLGRYITNMQVPRELYCLISMFNSFRTPTRSRERNC